MSINPYLNRLKADYEKLQGLEGSLVKILKTSGNPPAEYILQLRCKGIKSLSGGNPVFSEQHHLKIILSSTYPRLRPELVMLTPVFHPNFKGRKVCIGHKYSPQIGLDNLVLSIIRMIRFEDFSEADVYNQQALEWAQKNRDLIPLHITKQKVEVELTQIPLRDDFIVDYTAKKSDFFKIESSNKKVFYERLPKFQGKVKDFVKSNGGCLLVCGHMGVGKTSLINEVLGSIGNSSDLRVVGIHLNLARPIEPIRLKFKILDRLSQEFPEVKEIKTALERTKYQIKEIISDEDSTSSEMGIEGNLPKMTSKTEKKLVKGIEYSLNPYDDIEVEQDIAKCLQIVENKYNTDPVFTRLKRSFLNVFLSVHKKIHAFIFGTKLKIVVVLDELDKLDKKTPGQVGKVIESLKNIFTEANLSFILVSGDRTLDEFLLHHESDEPIFRKMISQVEYIPCLWDEIREIAYCAINEEKISGDKLEWYRTDFLDYLVYMSRGNLRQYNGTITSHKAGLALEFDNKEVERITKIANLERFVRQKIFSEFGENDIDANERDKQMLETYRIVDYIVNLKPEVVLTVADNTFSHEGSWLQNHQTLTQSTHYGVSLQNIIDVLVDMKYLSVKDN